MNQTTTVAKADLPACLQSFIKRDRIAVTLCDHFEPHDMQWSGGSRNIYHIVKLSNGESSMLIDNRPWPQNMGAFGVVNIEPGTVVVQTGTFMGKPSAGRIYARAEDVTKALPAPPPQLSHREQQVLVAIATLNSAGRKRFLDDVHMTPLQYIEICRRLVELGLIKPVGKGVTTTVAGSNAAREYRNVNLW